MKVIVAASAVLLLGVVSTAYAVQLKIVNKSKTSIHHLYVSPASQKAWGPDQLGNDDTVEPGHKFNLHGIEPGSYDIKIVAEDKTECEVDDVEFDESKEWVITEGILDKCAE